MRFTFFTFLLVITSFNAIAQDIPVNQGIVKDSLPAVNDPLYREDQFYASIAYNLMQDKPHHNYGLF